MSASQTKEMTLQELINGPMPVLVDFYTDWCAPCKMMAPILSELKSRMGEKLIIIKIDAEKNAAAAIRYQVRGVPTLILFQNGHILWQRSGVVQTNELQNIITSKAEGLNHG